MVIFHSYVKLPEGNQRENQISKLWTIHHPGSLLLSCRPLWSWHFLCFFADPTWPYRTWKHHDMGDVPSSKRLHNYGKIHHFSLENPLFLWPFSIAMLNYQRVLIIIIHYIIWYYISLSANQGLAATARIRCHHQKSGGQLTMWKTLWLPGCFLVIFMEEHICIYIYIISISHVIYIYIQ